MYAMIASKVPSRTPDKRGFSNLNCPSSEGIFTAHAPTTSPVPSTDSGLGFLITGFLGGVIGGAISGFIIGLLFGEVVEQEVEVEKRTGMVYIPPGCAEPLQRLRNHFRAVVEPQYLRWAIAGDG